MTLNKVVCCFNIEMMFKKVLCGFNVDMTLRKNVYVVLMLE
jgi:hypothetical protein